MNNHQIFISYRRVGGEDMAGRIADRLSSLGYNVFYDVESMRAGKFNLQIYSAIDSCSDVLVILPPNALDRCSDPEDWVRIEIAYAIQKKKNIIPILMRGFSFPDELPENISALKVYEGIKVPDGFFDAMMTRLLSLLDCKNTLKKVDSEEIGNYTEIKYNDGSYYKGHVLNGKFHGNGMYIYSTGDMYNGSWLCGIRAGYGELTWTNGKQWKGDFLDNNPYNGSGVILYYDYPYKGETLSYKGTLVNGVRVGEAEFVWKKGETCKGTYKNGLFTGQGTWMCRDGYYIGRIVKNKRKGRAILYSIDNDFKGVFKNDMPYFGKWVSKKSRNRKNRILSIVLFGKEFYV